MNLGLTVLDMWSKYYWVLWLNSWRGRWGERERLWVHENIWIIHVGWYMRIWRYDMNDILCSSVIRLIFLIRQQLSTDVLFLLPARPLAEAEMMSFAAVSESRLLAGGLWNELWRGPESAEALWIWLNLGITGGTSFVGIHDYLCHSMQFHAPELPSIQL